MFNNTNHKIEKIKLKSGSELINITIPHFPISNTSVWVKAGSKFDTVGKEGLAHFFEHLMMIKTKKYKTRPQLLEALESKGIFFNAFTNRELSHYYYLHAPEQTLTALGFLIDGLNNSIITKDDVKQEKNIILNEYLQIKNNPLSYIWHFNIESLFPKTNLGRPFFGNQKTIESITLDNILNFKNRYYQPSDYVFITIGQNNIKAVKKYIEKKLISKNLPKNGLKNRDQLDKPLPLNFIRQNTKNVTLGINYRYQPIKSIKSLATLELINEYLANHWTAKLVEKLRIKAKLTYWVNGEITTFTNASCLNLVTSTSKNNIKKILTITQKEVDNLKNNKLSTTNLNKYKNYYQASLLRKLTDPYELLWWYGSNYLVNNQIIPLQNYLKQIKSVSPIDIKKLSQELFKKENKSLTFIGPINKNAIN